MKVLLAEDDRDFGNILSQYVSINGFDVILARDGKEAGNSNFLILTNPISVSLM